ncbi:MAG TPA: hypothetical protein VFX89_03675 [Gammaproteobacteria bacterium]|nr:hypothetical protein [Gammaproteobacteria bacterium]
MQSRRFRTAAALAALLLAGLAAGVASAQPAGNAAKAADKPVPRVNGKPDLSGTWIPGSTLLLFEGEESVAAARAYDTAHGRAAAPPPEPPPYKPDAEKQRQYYLGRKGIDDPMARCLLSGVPRIMFRPLPFEIVQLPNRVLILYEIHHAFRIIPTDGTPHPDDLEPSYLGDSIGRWEGDTLVVDVTGFNDKSWLQGVGTVHSEKLRVTERYTRDTFETIRYEVTIEDPETLTKPWHMQDTMRLRPDERLREYECIESNEDIGRFEELLKTSEFK